MNKSDRFDRKRRRPKPRNWRQRKTFFVRPWFLKFMMVQIAPLTAKVVELVIEIIRFFWR
jgi:hypothetical protein